METIKRGKPPGEIPWFGTCFQCGSSLKATRDELTVEYDQRESGEFGRGRCPVCEYSVVFYPKSKERDSW